MRLYTVIPIARGVGKETLSYFGPDTIEIGSLVSIPLRKKVGHGIVIDAKNVAEMKSDIKSSKFSLRKITKVDSVSFLSRPFLEAAFTTAEWFATTTGSVLQSMVPALILEHALKLDNSPIHNLEEKVSHEPLVIQAEDDERFSHYKSFIRGQFAKQKSVYFCLPTVEDIRQAKVLLEKGIEQYTVILHSGISKKEFLSALETIGQLNHPILIIGTAPFLSVERSDLGTIILDRENARSYRTVKRPYIDMRVFVKALAKSKKILLLLGDMMLSVETVSKEKNDIYTAFVPLKMRVLSPATQTLIDMKQKQEDGTNPFKVLSPELVQLISDTKENSEHLFIFSGRKGLAPSTVCGDCGKIVTCERCSAPITLYTKKDEENFFMCNKCGLQRSAAERCTNCDSWKLNTLGIGIELVEDEIKKQFPDIALFRLDKDSVKNEKKALEIIKNFENTSGSILIGTELALFYMKKPIENIAVASIDTLFSLPDFRINEKICYLLLTMRALAEKNFLIQTRNSDTPVFEYALKGNLADFYRCEIDERKQFRYPPFSLFIKLSVEGKQSSAKKAGQEIVDLLSEYEPSMYPAFAPSKRGNPVVHVLIRKDSNTWPDETLINKLRSLPMGITVKVDPESLL
jgi:primosomal protein N' (replication factor Y)